LLTPPLEERRIGPLEPFEKRSLAGFALAALIQALLGSYRAQLAGNAYLAPLLPALGIIVCAVLWLQRSRHAPGGVLAMPLGLLIATIGVYTGYSAANAPFVGFVARYSVPLLLVLLGALLLFAEQDWEFQRVPFALAAIAFVIAQIVLTNEARIGAKPLPEAHGAGVEGIIGEMQVVPIAQSFVAAINAHDAASIAAQTTSDRRFLDSRGKTIAAAPDYRIDVTRWIPDGQTVVAYGTASGTDWSTPAAFRAVIRDGKIAEWQVYADLRRSGE
jgi:hypothetical protein